MRELLTRRLSAFSSSSLVNLVTGIGGVGDVRQHHPEKTKEKPTEMGNQVSVKEEQDIGKSKLQYVYYLNICAMQYLYKLACTICTIIYP